MARSGLLPDQSLGAIRSPNRRHDRRSFCKYMPVSTALAVLGSRSLRWSSPVLFNDPFDVPRELVFGVTPSALVEACGRQLEALIERPPADTTHLLPQLRYLIDAVKFGIDAELKAELLAGITETVRTQHPTGQAMDDIRARWRSWIPEARILCLTECPAHMAMWFHYADKYRGVVLELRCADELDSAWLAARPVTYPKNSSEAYTADGWAGLLTLRVDLAVETLLYVAMTTKTPDWSYESEWRVASWKRPSESGHYSDYKFNAEELTAVYLGPLISASGRKEVTKAAASYPRVKVIAASIGMSRDLDFTEVVT